MGRLMKVFTSFFKKRGTAPGKAVVIQTRLENDYEVERTAEMYHPPGVSSRPTKGDRVLEVPIGQGVRIAVASHNYDVEVEPDSGEIIIYSTNSGGDTVKAQIKLDDEGNMICTVDGNVIFDVGAGKHFDVEGNIYNLVLYQALASELGKLQVALNAHTHSGVTTGSGASGPPATPISIDISSAATETMRTGG